MLLEALLGGLIIGFCVSYFLLRFFDKIPAKNPILKSVILSFIVLIIVTMLIEVPARFLTTTSDALGILIHWAWTLAGERPSEYPLHYRHRLVCISHTQDKPQVARSNSRIGKEYEHERDYLHEIRFPGCSSAQSG